MIGLVIRLLQTREWIGVSQDVDIAKGVDEYTLNFKRVKKQIKRKYKWLKKR